MTDRSEPSTAKGYKCPKCGNAFAGEHPACVICGFVCTDETCEIVAVSKEGF